MPEEDVLQRAREDAREGKSSSTQAGEFVREEIEHVRSGKHGARNVKQAIAMGLSKARRAGVYLPPPGAGSSPQIRRKAARDIRKARTPRKPSKTRSRAVSDALKRESRRTTSRQALSRQGRAALHRRGASAGRRSARRAARTRRRSARSRRRSS